MSEDAVNETDAIEVKLHGTTDARVWAQEFIEVARREIRCPDCGVSGEIDEGWMIGWFANAIEVGRAAGLLAAGTPPETPTTRVLAERAGRRTT